MKKTGLLTKLVGKNEIEIFEQELPELREDGMLVEIGLTGICGTDIHIIENADNDNYASRLPFTLGHEVTGRICKMGPRAKETMYCDDDLSEGDRIVLYVFLPCGNCWWERRLGTDHNLICRNSRKGYFGKVSDWPYFKSGWGEYMYIQPGSWVWKIPENMSYETAVLTEPFSMGIRAVQKAISMPAWKNLEMLSFGGTVVVLGSGAIGILTAIAAKIAGSGKVILIGGPQETLAIAEEINAADATIDIADTTAEQRIRMVLGMTEGGLGADVVFEAAGVPEAFVDSLEMTKKEGTMVELGCLIDDGRTVPVNVARHIVAKDITLYGVTNQPPQDFTKAIKTMQVTKDRFNYSRLVTNIFDLKDVERAVNTARDSSDKGIKIALRGKGYQQ